jgi:hypothetical protein
MNTIDTHTETDRGDSLRSLRCIRLIPAPAAALALVLILIHAGIMRTTGEQVVALSWPANILVVISSLCICFRIVDRNRFLRAIRETDPTASPSQLAAWRYLTGLAAAMVVGLAATIVIYYRFIPGMLIYLVMQVLLISAFSGILHLSPKRFFVSSLRMVSLFFIILWAIIGPTVFFAFVYGGPESVIVIPYVTALVLMALAASLGLAYTKRPPAFRLMTFLGALSFVFSDTLIGHSAYMNPDSGLSFLIAPTYVLAILLISHAPLVMEYAQGDSTS